MKTHEHALISLGYGACFSLFLSENLLSVPSIYLAAVLGGECIDFIDHPLYHLVYRRNEDHVMNSQKILREKGWSAFFRYLNMVEDRRMFKGLLLHNIYGFLFFVILGFVMYLVSPIKIYILAFFGALILHMITDILGDLHILGHLENWIWVLPARIRSQKMGHLSNIFPQHLFHISVRELLKGKKIIQITPIQQE